MATAQQAPHDPAVRVLNGDGDSPFVLACDHASNRIPDRYGDLGLTAMDRLRHIAWDPGALAVSLELSALLDAPLVHSTVCRLVLDCNRDVGRHDLIPAISESTEIAANAGIGDEERQHRIATVHAPFHGAVDALLDARRAAGRETIFVTIHSFTPVYHGVQRPWPIGLIHGADPRFTDALRDALVADDAVLNVGWNEPYSGLNGVTYTIEHHGDGRGLETSMVEIRHDEILAPDDVTRWAERLARTLTAARNTSRT